MSELFIHKAPPGLYRVISANAYNVTNTNIRLGDIIKIEEKDGQLYRNNLSLREIVPLYYTSPFVWVEPLENEK